MNARDGHILERGAISSTERMAHSSAELAADVGVEKENTAPRYIYGEEEDKEDDEEEFVLLDLEEVFNGAALPNNCPYTLSGLDTMNPVLTLNDDLKLIGEYEETVGTVLVFTERDEQIPEDERIRGSNIDESGTRKRISTVYKTERRLKFRMMEKEENKESVVQEVRLGVL